MKEGEKRIQKKHQRDIRCPIHNRLIGKYDARVGVINVTYFCPLCKQEYTYTISRDNELR